MNIRERLTKGNQLYRSTSDSALRIETAKNGQHPFAIVVCCSDSRVIPEQIFSASIGELFVIRVAGNVLDHHQLGSIEYAAGHLHCQHVVVLGIQAAGRFRRLCPEAEMASFSTSPMKSWKPSERNETRIRRVS